MILIEHSIRSLPFPFFQIDHNFMILGVSEETLEHFPNVKSFLDIVDMSGHNKMKRFVQPILSSSCLELNLITKTNPLTLFDVYFKWEDDHRLNVFCVVKENHIVKIQAVINDLESQFSNESSTLLNKKEELERTLKTLELVIMQHDNLSNLGKLANGIANELQKPLTRIRGFIQLLKPSLLEVGKDHYANEALLEINQANNLLYQYISAAKPSHPKLELLNLHKLIHEIISSIKEDCSRINCKISYTKKQILPVIHVDERQIKQVFLNILRNGMESIQSSKNRGKGSIIIQSIQEEDSILISVTDNGIGFELDEIEKIFTPFFTTKEKGTGIGLAVSKQIIELHGGSIEVLTNTGPGATFNIRLPINKHS